MNVSDQCSLNEQNTHNSKRCTCEHTPEETTDENRLQVLGYGDWDLEDGKDEQAQEEGFSSPIELRHGPKDNGTKGES